MFPVLSCIGPYRLFLPFGRKQPAAQSGRRPCNASQIATSPSVLRVINQELSRVYVYLYKVATCGMPCSSRGKT